MNDWEWTGFWRIVMDLGFAAVGGVSLFYLRLVKRGVGNTKKIEDLRSDFREHVAKEHPSKSDVIGLREEIKGLREVLRIAVRPIDTMVDEALKAHRSQGMKRPTLGEALERGRRLEILRLLQSVSNYQLSDLILREPLHASGHRVGYQDIRRDLEWLAKKDLIETEELPGSILGARLKRKGEDVAFGIESVAGVARPPPEE